MADPLSPATRAIKRNLLVASVLGIAANAFKVSINQIPIAGMSISFDERLFAFLLFVTLSYFLGVFILYYAIDIKNIEITGHQKASQERFSVWGATFVRDESNNISKKLNLAAGENYEVAFGQSGGDIGEQIRTKAYAVHNPSILRGFGNDWLAREENLELFTSLDAVFVKITRWHSLRRLKALLLANLSYYAIRLLYFVRNYFVDGLLPILLGLTALAAISGHLNLHWIPDLLPKFDLLQSAPTGKI